MSRYAILKRVRPGPWTDDGDITVNVEQLVAIEEEPGCGGQFTRITLPGGREICVRGNYPEVRRAIVRQAGRLRACDEPSLFDQIFGRGFPR